MSSPFEGLPAELMIQILEYFDLSDFYDIYANFDAAIRTYYALCLTSKALHKAAMPFLYRTFDNRLGRDNRYKDESTFKFVRTICADEDLAKHVRRLVLSPSPGIRSPPPAEDLKSFVTRIRGQIRDKEVLETVTQASLASCCSSHLLVLLSAATAMVSLTALIVWQDGNLSNTVCCLCKDLEVLRLLGEFFADQQIREQYKRIRYIFVSDGSLPREPYTNIMPLLYLPALEIFHGRNLNSNSSTLQWSHSKPSPTLHSVDLQDSDLDTTAVGRIIGSAQHLRAITIEWGVSWDRKSGFRVFPPAIMSALRHHQHHLRSLELGSIRNGGLPFEGQPALGSLTDFTGLKVLRIDELLLLGNLWWHDIDLAGILPTSLKDLTIHVS